MSYKCKNMGEKWWRRRGRQFVFMWEMRLINFLARVGKNLRRGVGEFASSNGKLQLARKILFCVCIYERA